MEDYSFQPLPSPDHIKNLIEVLANLDFRKRSGCIKFSLDEAEKIGQEKANKILSYYSPEFELFNDVFEDQDRESKALSRILSDFLTPTDKKVDNHFRYEDYVKLIIRCNRLIEIHKPTYSVTKALHKKMGKEYDTSKGFWITDDCQKKRVFNKNLGERGWEVEKNMSKLVSGIYPKTTELPRGYKGFKADLLIEDNGKNHLVELKIDSINNPKKEGEKKSFFDVYMSLEMWQLYRKIYNV